LNIINITSILLKKNMTGFLYYSVSSGLTENEIFEIDKEVGENRKVVYELVANLPLNGKRKIKKCASTLYLCFPLLNL
jgi:hypothetical protein